MSSSIIFHNLTKEQLNTYIRIIQNNLGGQTLRSITKELGDDYRETIIDLLGKGFLTREDNLISLPSSEDLILHFMEQEYKFRSSRLSQKGDNNYLEEIKNYLGTVQKQLAHVETESRKGFLNLRTMVDKISDQGKEHLDIAFQKAIDKNSETGEWVSIPHISPVGLYEPIEELKNNFKAIIEELERSLKELINEYSEFTEKELSSIEDETSEKIDDTQTKILIENLHSEGLDNLENKKVDLLNETKKFSEEVLISLNEQVNNLEKNLGKDLMEQFDAIERLNELKPERIWLMLEETKSELMLYLNNVYSRILREINTLQLQVDFSKVGMILTNEAGKAIKKVDKIQQEGIRNLKPLGEIIDQLSDQ